MASHFPSIDFHDYHRRELPELLKEGRGTDAAESARSLGSRAFRLSESGEAHCNDALFQGDSKSVPNMRELARKSCGFESPPMLSA